MFLKILQNQVNISVTVSFLIKLQAASLRSATMEAAGGFFLLSHFFFFLAIIYTEKMDLKTYNSTLLDIYGKLVGEKLKNIKRKENIITLIKYAHK